MKRLKMILYAFGFCMLGLWVYSGYLYTSFISKPTSPVEATGNVIAFTAKSKTVYITEDDSRTYNVAFYASIVGFVLYAATYTLLRKRLGDKEGE